MQLQNSILSLANATSLQKSKLLPVCRQVTEFAVVCTNCCFVNRYHYHFCTHCGFPVHPNERRLAVYNTRFEKRKYLQQKCLLKVANARNALYVLAACSMLGIFYIFSSVRQRMVTGFVMILLGAIYAGLGRWSLQKPFTALLISLLVVLSFAAINAWAAFTSMFTTAEGFYLLIVQIILIYFLLQGVKGAFRADILEEECKL